MNSIDDKIKETKINQNKYTKRVNIWRFIYKFVGFLHIGSAGTYAVNAAKELFHKGSFTGLSMFIGLFISFIVSATILEKIIQYNQDKKTKYDLDLIVLDKEKTMLEKREERKKEREKKRITTNINYISHHNDFIQENDNEMKLSLGRK